MSINGLLKMLIRYIGKKAAKIIYVNNWTLEEYILKYGFDYELKKID